MIIFVQTINTKTMKKTILIIILSVAAICYFSSCERESSADVNQDRIYVLYELVYTESTDITFARSSFFFGSITGTKLELADPSNVSFETTPLGFMDALAYYETQKAGFVQTGEFTWTDTEDHVFINTVYVKQIAFPAVMDTIVKGQSYELTWVGDSLTSDESVYAFVNGTAENDEINVYQTTQFATSILMTAAQTEKLSPGTNTILLRRRYKTDPLQATSAGASCEGVYETVTVDIQVKE